MKLTETLEKDYENIKANTQQAVYKNTDPAIGRLLSIFEKIDSESQKKMVNEIYEDCINGISSEKFTKEIIESLLFAANNGDKKVKSTFGIFLSSLVNIHYEQTKNEEEYLLFTENISESLERMGYKMNGAQICIIGNAGTYLCQYMQSGKCIVSGNTDSLAGGYMSGGSLLLEGNVEASAGIFIEGGSITIKGTVEEYAGHNMYEGRIDIFGETRGEIGKNMKGGVIHTYANKPIISKEINGGTIYHQDMQIFPEGEK